MLNLPNSLSWDVGHLVVAAVLGPVAQQLRDLRQVVGEGGDRHWRPGGRRWRRRGGRMRRRWRRRSPRR